MLSALRPQATRLGLLRPLPRRLMVDGPTVALRSGDGEQRPAGRRPKPRTQPPLPVDQARSSPRQQKQLQQWSGGGALGGPRLTQLIQAAKSCEQVVQLVQQAVRNCNPIHFSAAANRMVKLHELQPGRGDSSRAAFQQLAQLAVKAELNPWAVTQLIWAAAKLWEDEGVKQPFGAQQAAWQQLLAAALANRQCKPQSVSNGLWAASKLGWPLEGSLAAASEAAAERQADRMDPQAVSNTLWAFANADWPLGSGAAAALVQRWDELQPEANAQDVSNSLWAISKLSLPFSSSLAAAAETAIERVAAQMTSQGVSNTLWAFANAGWPLGSRAAAALMQRFEQVLPQAEPQHVANSLWAAAKLGLPPSDSLQAALMQRFEEVLPQANPQEVANSLWASARLGLPLSSSQKATLAQALWRTIPAAKSQELANSLWACGKLRWSPDMRILAAALAAMQQLIAIGVAKPQELHNFLWGLAELQDQLAIRLPAELPALLSATAEWADSRWVQLPALDVVDLCYNLARLGHRPESALIGSATERCLERIAANEAAGVGFANFIWACSEWGHRLRGRELEQLVPAAVDKICATWPEPGRGSALLLAEGLTRQEGFCVGPGDPAAKVALEVRLLPLVGADIDLVTADQMEPLGGAPSFLASWAGLLAAIGLRLPAQQLESLCSYVGQQLQEPQPIDRSSLQRAFKAWGYQPGLELLTERDAA